MRIAVDAECLKNDATGRFIMAVFTKLAEENPLHHFIFMHKNEDDSRLYCTSNMTSIVLRAIGSNAVTKVWWYTIQIPLALKKCRADFFISTNRKAFFKSQVPQLLLITKLALKKKRRSNILEFARKRLTGTLMLEAKKIVTFSEFVKQEIVNNYKIGDEKISVVSTSALPYFIPLTWQQREEAKEQYSNGFEYFVCAADFMSDTNLLNILKAFSIFKKWQKSNMKLVIVGNTKTGSRADELRLVNYKYRNDICLSGKLEIKQWATVLGGAYSLISPSNPEATNLPVIESMQCQVPVIKFENNPVQSAQNAGQTISGDIAEQMKTVFKDEQFRKKLIEDGKQLCANFTFSRTINEFWKAIEGAVSR